jgi:dienelactone hydrolase
VPKETPRYLTAKSGIAELLKRPPSIHFGGKAPDDWRSWRTNFRQALVDQLGPNPDAAALDVEVLERVEFPGYAREKIIFNPDNFSSVPAFVLIPESASSARPAPAVLCAHGHGLGKDPVSGVGEAEYQKQFAVELTLKGFIAIAPDWRGFGERKDSDKWIRRPHRDGCNVIYNAFGYFGYQLLNLDINDAKRCLDYLQSRPDVDSDRLGCMGCSFGGTMTTYTAALDERIKAAVIICYLSSIEYGLKERESANSCGSQFMFALRQIGEISDVAGLIAPRACMAQIGSNDSCFVESDALSAYRHLESIYRAAGAQDMLELDNFEGEHEVDLEPAIDFLERRLLARE